MKVMLISANTTRSPYPVYPIGMSIVAAALTRGGHEVAQADFLEQQTSLEAIGREVAAFAPELVGISVRNIDNVNLASEQYYIDNVRDLVTTIRGVTAAKVILGGAGFSLLPAEILRATGADFGIVGEGEQLTVDFVDNAARGRYPVDPLVRAGRHLGGGEIGAALYDERLLDFYLHSGNVASVQTKRGCPCKCVYCSYPLLEGEALRPRDPRTVVDDIERLKERGAKYIFFVDSVFNDDEGAYLAVVDEMLRRGLSIPWTAYFKPGGGLNDETVARMKRTGLAAAEVGGDATTDPTLKQMGKGFSFAEIRACNDLLTGHGIAVSHFFMFGGPGETEATVHEGIANILSLEKSVSFIFMGIRILPDTPLARLAVRDGLLAADADLLHPVYYLSPAVAQDWLEATLRAAFAGVRHCVFPPDAMDSKLEILHKLGYTGPMWELLLPGKRERQRHAPG